MVDAPPPSAATVGPDRAGTPTLLTGWGLTAPTRARVRPVEGVDDVKRAMVSVGPRGVLARGLGRAYGDAAQNAGGAVLDMRGLAEIGELDEHRGSVTVGAGASLGELIDRTLPRGWFPAVVPGTRHVSVGGAVAADIHGKNHHRDGCFSRHVDSFELMTPDGELRDIHAERDYETFAATAGGMGLTGVIVSATLRLIAVESGMVRVQTARMRDLDEALAEMDSTDDAHRYSVAWIDCLARAGQLGRSVLMRGDHAGADEVAPRRRRLAAGPLPPARLAAPPWAPSGLLRRETVGAFNELYFRRSPRTPQTSLEPLHSFFFPLDAIAGWNRLYGRRGLVQYQFVVPFGAEVTLRRAVERLSSEGAPALLAVLKRFGAEHGMISFPMGGWTLALDVPAATPGLAGMLDALDEMVAQAGGRVYLAKDSRLRPEMLGAMYPRLGRWNEARARLDPAGRMRSDLARRLSLTSAASQDAGARARRG